MAENLQIEQVLSLAAQAIKDTIGNTSSLALSTDNIGIGTTSPETKLDVNGGAITIRNTGEGAVLLFLGIERHWQLRQFGTGTSAALELASVGGGGNKNFIINTTGGVGVGTPNPQARLHVEGDIRLSGAVNIMNPGEGHVLLILGTERHWQLRQFGIGTNAALELASVGGGGNKNFLINTTGRVGIGTTSPQARLHVEGDIVASGDIRLTGADCAEAFDIGEAQSLEPGMVMVIGDDEKLHPCLKAYDTRVAGVISGAGDYKPGIILGNHPSHEKRLPLALTGKVYCRVDAQYASIAIGDLLTTSPSPGHAMRANDHHRAFGAVLGKALRSWDEGTGAIPILVALQ